MIRPQTYRGHLFYRWNIGGVLKEQGIQAWAPIQPLIQIFFFFKDKVFLSWPNLKTLTFRPLDLLKSYYYEDNFLLGSLY